MNKTMYKVNTKFGEFITHNPEEDSIISKSLHEHNIWEPHIVNIISNNIKPGDIFLDIGANIGWHSFVAKYYGAEVIAFEPVQRNYDILCQNISMEKDKLYKFALGTENYKTTISINPENLGNNYVGGIGEEIDVKMLNDCLTMDEIKKVKILKIDVETFETNVMKGGENIFRNLPTNSIIIMETVPFAENMDMDYLKAYMGEYIGSYYMMPINFEIKQNNNLHHTMDFITNTLSLSAPIDSWFFDLVMIKK